MLGFGLDILDSIIANSAENTVFWLSMLYKTAYKTYLSSKTLDLIEH